MAPQYKLHYFNFRGLGEFIRYLFAYGKIEFEDFRIDIQDSWGELKKTYPNEKLPLLEVDGQKLNQSTAIGRLLAKKVGLAGADDWEAARIDASVDDLNDLRTQFVAAAMHQDPATKANLLEKFGKEAVPLFFSRLEKQVKENNGYFVNGKLSWADLYLAAYSKTYDVFFPNIFEPYPALQGVIDKVHAEPNIKIWVEKRPETEF
ncbi:hypothetical protein R5R35_010757 [Gryllus longicercus]|uniref:glutathione transferase n=1 Tax=Gryllus longicercus TaxID=2509291 RepID=A0AAN9VHD3_9ORTH